MQKYLQKLSNPKLWKRVECVLLHEPTNIQTKVKQQQKIFIYYSWMLFHSEKVFWKVVVNYWYFYPIYFQYSILTKYIKIVVFGLYKNEKFASFDASYPDPFLINPNKICQQFKKCSSNIFHMNNFRTGFWCYFPTSKIYFEIMWFHCSKLMRFYLLFSFTWHLLTTNWWKGGKRGFAIFYNLWKDGFFSLWAIKRKSVSYGI